MKPYLKGYAVHKGHEPFGLLLRKCFNTCGAFLLVYFLKIKFI
jgi:hypothetical protein